MAITAFSGADGNATNGARISRGTRQNWFPHAPPPPRSWRYMHESQQALHRGDRGFEYVTAIQDKEVTWGRG